jgi:transposase
MSLATGAAGVQLGPNALALAADLNKAKGLSMRKTCAVLRDCFALRLSAGGLSQALDRLAAKVQCQYEAIAKSLRQASVVHSDETSWWVGRPGWWLWVFANSDSTLYLVDQGRGRSVLTEMLGADLAGVLVSDCLAIYDDATPRQQKCYAHPASRDLWHRRLRVMPLPAPHAPTASGWSNSCRVGYPPPTGSTCPFTAHDFCGLGPNPI